MLFVALLTAVRPVCTSLYS